MKNLTIYVGKHVEQLKWHSVGGRELGIFDGNVYIHMVDDTVRAMPYSDQHDSVFCENIVKEMSYVLPHWNMHISTHKTALINLVGVLIENNLLQNHQVKIILLDEENSNMSECFYDLKGYLGHGWIAGFMHADGEEWKKFK